MLSYQDMLDKYMWANLQLHFISYIYSWKELATSSM